MLFCKPKRAMFALSMVNYQGKPDRNTLPCSNGQPRSSAKERTFMDILTCRKCKKNKSRRNKKSAENEGYSSTEEEYYSKTQTLQPVIPQIKIQGIGDEGSLKRPLTCKLPFGVLNSHKKQNKPSAETSNSSISETWRSLPNLRSPVLAVRAMTIKFKALTGKDGKDDTRKQKIKKKARFNEHVDVILHDDEGIPFHTQSVKIKYDEEDNMAAASNQVNGEPCVPPPTPRAPKPDMIRMDYMDIKRQPDGQKYLKCVIYIGMEYDRRRITVRSAMGGSKLVLIAYKSEPLGDGTYYWRQFVEKFRLPHAIDPNQVTATMHAAGDLVIEAPLFEFETDT